MFLLLFNFVTTTCSIFVEYKIRLGQVQASLASLSAFNIFVEYKMRYL